jgi:hypothetical protein
MEKISPLFKQIGLDMNTDSFVEQAVQSSRWIALLKAAQAKQVIGLDVATAHNLSSEVMHHIALAKHELNLAIAQLEREGV